MHALNIDTVVDYPDGRLAIRYRGLDLPYTTNELLSPSSTPLPAMLVVTFLSVRNCVFSIRERPFL